MDIETRKKILKNKIIRSNWIIRESKIRQEKVLHEIARCDRIVKELRLNIK